MVCAYVCMHICICTGGRGSKSLRNMYMFLCMCVCLCVCVLIQNKIAKKKYPDASDRVAGGGAVQICARNSPTPPRLVSPPLHLLLVVP